MRFASASLVVLATFTASVFAQNTKPLPYMNPALSTQQRVDDLVSRMTLDEKVSQMVNASPAIPRLGIPAYDWWSEGLHGIARSGYATMFPQAIGMAATWNAPMLGQIGTTISTEARAKYNEAIRHDIHSIYYGLTIWSPNINIFRDPRWGRGQETYGEDPYLTGQLGVSFVKGLQGTDPNYFKVIATPKHFAVHSGPESTRHSANVEPTQHDLWDTYLPAFRAAVTEGHADSIMCAYNAVDHSPACANEELLQHILRDDWKFKGFVTSDCGAIDDFYMSTAHHLFPDAESASAAGVKAGTDTSCVSTYLALTDAVKKGLVAEADIDLSVKRLFMARYQLGLFDSPAKVVYDAIPFSVVNSPAHQELALEVARQSMVLLKNDESMLPLRAGIKTIAVVGPNAATLAAIEGNYNAIPLNPVLPVDGIVAEFKGAKVLYAQGSPYADGVALPVPRTILHPDKNSTVEGLKGEYFATNSFEGKPVLTRIDKQIDFDWNSAKPTPEIPADAFAVRWTGTIAMPDAGKYDFSLQIPECRPCHEEERFAVYFDEKPVAGFAPASAEYQPSGTPHFTLTIPDTKRHNIRVEYLHKAPLFNAGITLEWSPKESALQKDAVAAAQKADVVLAFVGLSPLLEGEEMPIHVEGFAGGDRTDIQLPAAQQQMLEAVAATGKPLVVVLMNGSALAVNWANEHANAILEAWYPGQAGARAIAETLDGKNNPGGRLPVTFYASLDQLPAFDNYAMANRTYRYFKGAPLYGFGYGLSYTTFAYSNLKLSTNTLHAGDSLTVEADIKNTGTRAGDEVAELYLLPPQTTVSPIQELNGFQRLHLAPGESRHVSFTLDPRTLSQVDEKGTRAVSAGSYVVFVGGSQPTPQTISAQFSITGTEELPR
ncbi:glycoside hydrolase family 3 C-terminal domain-containing protein [Granulicella arctica]|uniref:Beta-glucosidase n=1 Tax=Granulicella arctica TaxID=940613 RepID=A0A7Y9PJM3_9BACT|nr:glycoside hydrolase family 3 C-terminal domain-containing protein [Granulicella arctica]NYF81127.1 beta-glucosidase [Granulicella arctica]